MCEEHFEATNFVNDNLMEDTKNSSLLNFLSIEFV